MSRVCVWVHDAALSPEDVALKTHPDGPAVFVFDEPGMREEPHAFRRHAFIFDGVCDLFGSIPNPVKEVRLGPVVEEILGFCSEHGCDRVAVTDHPEPATRLVIERLGRELEVSVYPRPELAEYNLPPIRFSRYWNKVAKQVLGHHPKSGKKRWHQ